MTIQAPYRFVPLSNLVVLPDWAEKVSHDVPFKDGLCGEIDVLITTHGEVCVGGGQTPSTAHTPNKVEFYRTPEGKLAIPGSSLKGMLRNVLEIATFSRFSQVENQRLGVRDISEANNFYATEVTRNVQAGWLNFENNQWVIYSSDFARVHQKDIVDYFGLSYKDWTTLKTIQDRYEHKRLGLCPQVKYKDQGEKKYNKVLAILNKAGNFSGHLVMTGQPGSFYNERNPSQPRAAKKYEFIFYNRSNTKLIIPTEVMSGFKQIHEDTIEWKFWLSKLSSLKQGVPVFFQKENTNVKSLGLAMMYKLAYKNSIYDAINHTCTLHTQEQQKPDLADLIFGHIREKEQTSLRGRVNIGLAQINQNVQTTFSRPTVLSSPKPTYYPHYIKQTETPPFNQLMMNKVELSGWKRYPIKNVELPPLNELVEQNNKVQVCLETVPADTYFSYKMRLHNLRPIEIGALLWSLDFGGKKSARHSIGTGKPYGFGQVSLSIQKAKLRRNDAQKIDDVNVLLEGCRLEFKAYMDQIIQQINPKINWEQTDELKALLEYCDPNNRLALDYLEKPLEFAQLRRKDNLEEFTKTFHQYKGVKLPAGNEPEFHYVNQLEDSMAQALGMVTAQVAKQEREQLRESASAEDQIILDLEDFIDRASTEVTKTIKSKAAKQFKVPFENDWENFNDVHKARFKELAEKGNSLIDDKMLSKIVKRILEAK